MECNLLHFGADSMLEAFSRKGSNSKVQWVIFGIFLAVYIRDHFLTALGGHSMSLIKSSLVQQGKVLSVSYNT